MGLVSSEPGEGEAQRRGGAGAGGKDLVSVTGTDGARGGRHGAVGSGVGGGVAAVAEEEAPAAAPAPAAMKEAGG